MAELITALPEQLYSVLQREKFLLLNTQDVMFYGARFVTEPEFEKTYDIRAAEKPAGQVFDAMKKA
ncbi:hypothetical protein [Paenibacillus sedimenti]|uniref:Uncharacterized protein n=1 Tax=Paenibacillus sedimenti TaxID=2770274 RepID=A0A926QH50_9BACL|nr:hypothetical protein [Paenibacillus sedimenti]MBD0379151.1 hypothetical protein [Paenibacillus sedimenti]